MSLPQKTKRLGAAGILGTITLGLIWDVYSSIDTRIRNVEIDQSSTREIVKEIKKDTETIKNILIKRGLE